jgi:hypothetical protein
MFNTKSTTIVLLVGLATATAAAGAETTTGCKAGAFQVERTTNESDYCISCPEVEDGRKGTPKIAVCTPRPSNVEVISSNDIIVQYRYMYLELVAKRLLLPTESSWNRLHLRWYKLMMLHVMETQSLRLG